MKKKILVCITIWGGYLVAQTTSIPQPTRNITTQNIGNIGSRIVGSTPGQRGFGANLGGRGQGSFQQDYRNSQIANFLIAIIGGYLRHPDPKVRIQAIQSLSGAMVSNETRSGNVGDRSGVRGLFNINVNNAGNTNVASGGMGGAIFIPDLFILANDPDPEVADMALMGLDILFGTDAAILRFMDDPDPIVRQYATKIYATRSFGGEDVTIRGGQQNNEYSGSLKELVALRTLLVRLKYEKDEGVRKILTDSIELYLQSVGLSGEQQGRVGGTNITGIFGVDPSIIKYLNDDNPEIRKNAVKIISAMEYNPQILNILLERLRKETDDEVKQEIEKAIESYTRERSRAVGTSSFRR